MIRIMDGEQQADIQKDNHPTPTILIAEDEVVILKLTASILAIENYNVLTASSSGAALHMAELHKGAIDLLISDIGLPEISGIDLAKKVQAFCPNMKIMFMSGQTSHVVSDHGVPSKQASFIQKPFRPMELLTKVQEVLLQS